MNNQTIGIMYQVGGGAWHKPEIWQSLRDVSLCGCLASKAYLAKIRPFMLNSTGSDIHMPILVHHLLADIESRTFYTPEQLLEGFYDRNLQVIYLIHTAYVYHWDIMRGHRLGQFSIKLFRIWTTTANMEVLELSCLAKLGGHRFQSSQNFVFKTNRPLVHCSDAE